MDGIRAAIRAMLDGVLAAVEGMALDFMRHGRAPRHSGSSGYRCFDDSIRDEADERYCAAHTSYGALRSKLYQSLGENRIRNSICR